MQTGSARTDTPYIFCGKSYTTSELKKFLEDCANSHKVKDGPQGLVRNFCDGLMDVAMVRKKCIEGLKLCTSETEKETRDMINKFLDDGEALKSRAQTQLTRGEKAYIHGRSTSGKGRNLVEHLVETRRHGENAEPITLDASTYYGNFRSDCEFRISNLQEQDD